MKKKHLVLLALLGVFLNAEDIDTILTKITTKRVSNIDSETILATPSPMPKLIIENNKSIKDINTTLLKAKEENFKLIAIMNNSVNINGKWYKLGQKIGSYKLEDIMEDAVFLKNDQKEKMLIFDQNHSKINITVGR